MLHANFVALFYRTEVDTYEALYYRHKRFLTSFAPVTLILT